MIGNDFDRDAPSTMFETTRLQLFGRYGFDGTSRRLGDDPSRLTYVIERRGDSPPVVFLHGGLSQAGSWCLVAGRVPGTVFIPDRPGWGLTYPVDFRTVDVRESSVAWLDGVMDDLELRHAILVGASIGGFIAAAYALAHPQRVDGLVLVGSPPGLRRRLPVPLRLMGNPVLGPLMTKAKITDPEVNRRRVFKNLVAHPEAVPVDVLQNDIDAMALPGAGHAAFTMMRSMTTIGGFRPSMLIADELAALACPTTFLWGDKDTFVPHDVGEGVAATMPSGRFQLVPDAGHCVELDRPDLVADAIAKLRT